MPPRPPARCHALLGAGAAALVWACLLASAASPAAADDWTDARGAFRAAQKESDWKLRRDAYVTLANFDGAEAAAEALSALDREESAAVVAAGLDALTLMRSKGAVETVLEQARKGGGRARLLALVGLQGREGPGVEALLLEVAAGSDPAAAAQAVLALPETSRAAALPVLVKLLKDDDWQVRSAAARRLGAWKEASAVEPLAAALAAAKGRDRADVVQALEAITGQRYGNDPAAWKQLAAGADPASIEARPELPPSAFGVPIYGRRVVVCLDLSLRMGDPHPFERDRLQALCEPPDGNPIPWFRMKTNQQFATAHVLHLVDGLPKGTRLEILLFNERVEEVLGGLTATGAGTKKVVEERFASLYPDNGIATYPVLDRALDIAGPKDRTAWKSGPDEILFVTVNIPNTGEVTEAPAIAAAIGLKARLRMVPIHTVGLGLHPYDMCRELAERTGGTYVNLVK